MTPIEARRIRAKAARTSHVERLAQIALALVVVGVAYALMAWIAPVMAPVLLSLLLAYFLDPVIDWFERRRVGRTIAILFVATVSLAALSAIGAVVVPAVAVEIGHALTQLPGWVSAQYESLRAVLSTRFDIDLEAQLLGGSALAGISTRVQAAVGALANTAVDSVSSLLNIVLIPIFTFYFLRDFDTLKLRPLDAVPERYRDEVLAIGKEMDEVVGAWLRGQVQVAMALSVFYAIALGALGLKMGVFIGIIAGLLNVVPYLGLGIGVALSALMVLIYGEPSQLIGVAVVFVVAQLIDDYVLKPRLVGEKVGMGPMMVMVVLLLGGSLFGFFGLLLSIPAVAAAGVVIRRAYALYKRSDFFVRESDAQDLDHGPSHTALDGLDAADVIATLGLIPHPEGGWYRELWRSPATDGERPALTSITFLLDASRGSHWHRVDAAETWAYHAGAPLELRIADPETGVEEATVIGDDPSAGHVLQSTVPPGDWQSARTLGQWTLVGCMVGPGFVFDGFELAPPDWQPSPRRHADQTPAQKPEPT